MSTTRSRWYAVRTSQLVVVLCLSCCSAHEGRLRSSRKLAEGEYIWGVCGNWTHDVTGCSFDDGMQCSSFLSPGPEDADITINITNLPPSTSEQEVHLQWWSPRRSPYPYDPLHSPHGAAIFWDMRKAYPKHDEGAFNGGNVRVGEDGRATIRVRQPATYRVSRWVLHPHIHLRLCMGENFAHLNPDTIFFTVGGPVMVPGFHGPNHSAAAEMLESALYVPGHEASEPKTSTSTLAPSSSSLDGDALAQMPDDTMGDGNGVLLSDSDTSDLDDLRIQDAKEALGMDALEFSPVYQCLLEGTYFSYYTSECVDSCPADADVHVGQCVRKNTSSTAVTLRAIWALDVSCGKTCWHDKLNVTLHHVRLAVADQLRIPFQEVEHASLGLVEAASRRLADSADIHDARLQVRVRSRRVSAGADGASLEALLARPEDASWLLGFDVHGVHVASNEEWREEGYTVLTDASDPYSRAYDDEVKQGDRFAPPGVLPMEDLPAGALIGIAAAVALIGSAVALYLWYKRRKAAARAREGEIPVVTGRPAKGVDDGGPAKPSTVGAPAEDDDDVPRKPHPPTGCAGLGVPPGAPAAAGDGSRI